MIQSGYCLIDLSWFTAAEYTQGEVYTTEKALKAYKDIKGAINSEKIVFLKMGATAVRVLTNMLDDGNRAIIQAFEPADIDQDGIVTFKIIGMMFSKDKEFMWKMGGIN